MNVARYRRECAGLPSHVGTNATFPGARKRSPNWFPAEFAERKTGRKLLSHKARQLATKFRSMFNRFSRARGV